MDSSFHTMDTIHVANSILQPQNNLFPSRRQPNVSPLRSDLVRGAVDSGCFVPNSSNNNNNNHYNLYNNDLKHPRPLESATNGIDNYVEGATEYHSFRITSPVFESSFIINDVSVIVDNRHEMESEQNSFASSGGNGPNLVDNYDTVCIKAVAEDKKEDCPWKHSDLKDLFSPLKLESMFEPPPGVTPTPQQDLESNDNGKDSNQLQEQSISMSMNGPFIGPMPPPKPDQTGQFEEHPMFEGTLSSPVMDTKNMTVISDISDFLGGKDFEKSVLVNYTCDSEDETIKANEKQALQKEEEEEFTREESSRLPAHLLIESSPVIQYSFKQKPSDVINLQLPDPINISFEPSHLHSKSHSKSHSHHRKSNVHKSLSSKSCDISTNTTSTTITSNNVSGTGDGRGKSQSIQLFQLNYDTITKDRLNALVSELEQVDINTVPALEDDLGVDIALKRLKLSEKSVHLVESPHIPITIEDEQKPTNDVNLEEKSFFSNENKSFVTVISPQPQQISSSPSLPDPLAISYSQLDNNQNQSEEKETGEQASLVNRIETGMSMHDFFDKVEEESNVAISRPSPIIQNLESSIDNASEGKKEDSLAEEKVVEMNEPAEESHKETEKSIYEEQFSTIGSYSITMREFKFDGKSLDDEIRQFVEDERRLSNLKRSLADRKYVPLVPHQLPDIRHNVPSVLDSLPPSILSKSVDSLDTREFQSFHGSEQNDNVDQPNEQDSLEKVEKALDSLLAIKPDLTAISQQQLKEADDFEDNWLQKRFEELNVQYCGDENELIIPPGSLDSIYGLLEIYPNLKSLIIDNNKLYQLAGAPGSLMKLSSVSNNLSKQTLFSHLIHLQELSLAKNQIQSFKQFENLIHLRVLDLDDNLIDQWDGIDQLPSLTILSLRRNRLLQWNQEFPSKSLERLDIEGNKIEVINADWTMTFPNLKWISLRKNRLKVFSAKSEGENLLVEHLDLSENEGLNELELDCCPFIHLKELILNGIEITRIKTVQFHKIRHLSLCQNRQNKAIGGSFDWNQWKNLCALGMNGISLARNLDHLLMLSRVEQLNLEKCNIRSLPGKFGRRLCQLAHLNLANNMLCDLEPLRKLKRLETLILYGNELKSMSECVQVLSGMPRLRVLDLRMNPLTAKFYHPTSTIESLADSKLDRQHLASVNDLTFIRRLCYRSTLLSSVSAVKSLQILDGLPVTQSDWDKAETQYRRLREKVKSQINTHPNRNTQKERLESSENIYQFNDINVDTLLEDIKKGNSNKNSGSDKKNGVTFWIPVDQTMENTRNQRKPPPFTSASPPVAAPAKPPRRSKKFEHSCFVYSEDGKPMKVTGNR